jgi:aspartate racemase
MGEYAHPEITMHSLSLADYMSVADDGDWEPIARLMVRSAEKVAAAGADFAICPDNTVHQVFDQIQSKSRIPWLHIADEVAREANRQGFARLGVTGTRLLMEGPVYPDALDKNGIAHVLPAAEDRAGIDRVIFKELVKGEILDASRLFLQGVIGRLAEAGCDAVVLGCTELPLIVTPEVSPLPTLDSTRILARAAIATAVEEA